MLGTAQFGKPYGFNNVKKKRISPNVVKKILNYCYNKGIIHLDTAFDYNFNLKLPKSTHGNISVFGFNNGNACASVIIVFIIY